MKSFDTRVEEFKGAHRGVQRWLLYAAYSVCSLAYHLTVLEKYREKSPNIVLYFESLTRPKHHNRYNAESSTKKLAKAGKKDLKWFLECDEILKGCRVAEKKGG